VKVVSAKNSKRINIIRNRLMALLANHNNDSFITALTASH